MALGPYAHFIVGCYALCAIVVAVLVGWIALDHRAQRAHLKTLEQAGIVRRSRTP